MYAIRSYYGHSIEVHEKINGQAKFGIDVRLPDMKYAALVQPRVFGAKIKSYDDSKAKNMPGILKIKQLPNEKIAVIATHWYQAKTAAVITSYSIHYTKLYENYDIVTVIREILSEWMKAIQI